jgi:hypothetical protein
LSIVECRRREGTGERRFAIGDWQNSPLNLRRSIAALFLLLLFAHANPIGVPCQTLIVSDGISTVYPVEHGFLVPGTDTVYVSGVRLDSSDYTFDYNSGSIVLWRRPEKWSPIRVVFRCVRLPGVPKEYRLHELPVAALGTVPVRGQSPSESAAAPVADTTSRAESTALDLSGSKTLGVSFGGENAGIDQATRVAITGSVEGVSVEAELSDQSSPIPAEGTTRDIEELDKLLVSLRGKQWRGSFGDVDLLVPTGSFGAIERKAIGATAEWGVGQPGTINEERGAMNEMAGDGGRGSGIGVYGGYATPKGLFGRVELVGVDGSQGPYVLAPDGRAAQIVPGSEEVYLNGSRMVRGWDADYTIDYSSGELLFTNRRVIDRLSRVEATFQYVTGDYSRAVMVGGARARVNGRGAGGEGRGAGADFDVGLFREGDDPSASFVEDLSAAEKESLAAIGADTTRAWLDGATYAGTGQGDYVKSGDHYQYVGRDSGDYQVRFTLVGDSLGDYRYNDTILAYSFAGSGFGNYVARRRISLPKRSEAAYARAGFEYRGFSAGVEGLVQRRDLNLFAAGRAPVDAGALNLDAGWQDSAYGATYKHRLQGQQFEALGASSEVDYTYRWAGTTTAERRSSDEVALRAKPLSFLSLRGEAGRLDRFDGGPIKRYQGSARAWWLGYDVARVADVTRQSVLATPRVGWFFPKAGWQSEVNAEEKSSVLIAGLEVKPVAALTAGVDYRHSGFYASDSLTRIWQRTSLARLFEARADWTGGTAYRLGVMAGLNDRHFDEGSDEDWNQLLASLSGSATPRAGLRVQADFNQSYRKVQLRDEVFRYVGPGEGQYRRDSVSGRYYVDPKGDYERAVVATGRFTQAREWSLNGSGDVSMFDPAALSGSFSQTRTSTDSSILTDLSSQDLRLVVKEFEPAVTPTIGASSEFSVDRNLAATGRASSHQQAYVELFSDRLPEVEGRARLEVERVLRRLSGGEVDLHEDGWRVELNPVIGARLRLEAELGYERKAVTEPVSYPELGRFMLAAVDASLARTFSFGSRTRVRASLEVVHRNAIVQALPFDVGLTEPLGTTPGAALSFEHSFSGVLSASARYSFKDRPDEPSEHTLSAQLKAYF